MNPAQIDLTNDNGGDLLSGTQMRELRGKFNVKRYKFEGLSQHQRQQMFENNDKKLEGEWDQFVDVCHGLVEQSYIKEFQKAIKGNGSSKQMFDYLIVISSGKFVLSYAMVVRQTIEYDSQTKNLLRQSPHNQKFDDNKTLNIKLLCSRDGSGMGKQVLLVCENLAIELRCASLHLDAVTTAYNFYKHVGFSPYSAKENACSTPILHTDEDKFTAAIHRLALKMVHIHDGRNSQKIHDGYVRFRDGTKDIKLRIVMEGVVYSRLYPEFVAKSWFCSVNHGTKTRQKRTYLENLLKEIVNNAFMENNQYSESIPMTKCLIHGSGDSGGKGKGKGKRKASSSGGDGSYGGGGASSGGGGSGSGWSGGASGGSWGGGGSGGASESSGSGSSPGGQNDQNDGQNDDEGILSSGDTELDDPPPASPPASPPAPHAPSQQVIDVLDSSDTDSVNVADASWTLGNRWKY